MNTLRYIKKKYGLTFSGKMPIEIPDKDRMNLASLFNELGFKVGVEIGTARGRYAKSLCRRIPDLRLYCVDPWKKHDEYVYPAEQRKFDDGYEATKKRLAPYDVRIIRKLSLEAVKEFEPGSLDFVYIDGNHEFSHAASDIYAWSKMVRPGGIVSGHDFRRFLRADLQMHVVEAVMGYTIAYKIRPWFVLGSRYPEEGEVRDFSRSWFWVKEG